MKPQPGVLLIAAIVAFALVALPLGLPWWARVLVLVTMPAWLGPIVIRFRQTQPTFAEFVLLPGDGSGAPAPVTASFDTARDTLAPPGFLEVGRLRQTNVGGALAGFVQLLEHPTVYTVCSRLVMLD